MRSWKQCSVAIAVFGACVGVTGYAAATGVAPPVSLAEAKDWVLSDTYYPGPEPQPDPGFAWPAWPVVRLDVTNSGASLGVYGVIVGANPGSYDWSGMSEPAMQFGGPWFPAYEDPGNLPYLPQQTNGDSTIDWTTELLTVSHAAAGDVIQVEDSILGVPVAFKLPGDFSGYDHVYRFATTGPFVACGGGCYPDSVPLPLGQTFSYYVTGGLASPMVYLDQIDFNADGSFAGTFNGGTIAAAVPEPAATLLLCAGLGLLAAVRRRVQSRERA